MSARGFIDEWRKAAEDPTAFFFPPNNSSTLLVKDTSTRDSKCRGCEKNIPAKTSRIVCLSRFLTPRKMSYGGVVVGQKFFYHEGCFATFTKKPVDLDSKCTNCGRFTSRTKRVYARIGKSRYVSTMVCEDCRDKLGLCRCRHCGKDCLPALLSPSVGAGSGSVFGSSYVVGDLTCDICAENWDIVRVKEQVKQRKRDQEIELRLLRIRELIITNEFLTETSEPERHQP